MQTLSWWHYKGWVEVAVTSGTSKVILRMEKEIKIFREKALSLKLFILEKGSSKKKH